MKFHFFASLEGDKKNYKKIFDILEKLKCQPISHHVFKRNIEDVKKETEQESELYAKKMVRWINQADFIIAEVTEQGVSTGFEIMASLQRNKPVAVLYEVNKGYIPHTLRGIQDEKLQIYSYQADKEQELWNTLKMIVEDASEQSDMRFNFFISPNQQMYLDWIAKNKKIPRSVYLRDLIEADMNKNINYNEVV